MNLAQFEYGTCWYVNSEERIVTLSARKGLATGEVHTLWEVNEN